MKTYQGAIMNNQETISFDIGGECFIRIEQSESGYQLSWSDYVANEWTEQFTELSLVFARISALAKCQEQNWQTGFVQSPSGFVSATNSFLSSVVR